MRVFKGLEKRDDGNRCSCCGGEKNKGWPLRKSRWTRSSPFEPRGISARSFAAGIDIVPKNILDVCGANEDSDEPKILTGGQGLAARRWKRRIERLRPELAEAHVLEEKMQTYLRKRQVAE